MPGRSKVHEEQFRQISSWIFEALIQLLEEKPYRTISVEDITKKAGVARPTFYRHFASKDDVIFSFLEVCFSPVPPEAKNLQNDTGKDILFLAMPLEQFLRYAKILKTILISDAEYLFFIHVKKRIDHVINLYDERLRGDEKTACRYMIQFTGTGYTQVICDWIKNDMPVPVEKLSKWLTHTSHFYHDSNTNIPHVVLNVD
jgi:AcrR family transcriptional regulator